MQSQVTTCDGINFEPKNCLFQALSGFFLETLFRVTLPTLKSRETPDASLPIPAIVETKMASR